jgi:hypothetical protein
LSQIEIDVRQRLAGGLVVVESFPEIIVPRQEF